MEITPVLATFLQSLSSRNGAHAGDLGRLDRLQMSHPRRCVKGCLHR